MTRAARRAVVGVLVGVLAAGCGSDSDGRPEPLAAAQQPAMPAGGAGPFPIIDVVDGDTVTARRDGAVLTVRLLGVDTPETVDPDQPVQCFGPEATARTTDLLAGQQVWLERDASQDAVDRYGRALAYLWLPGDQLINLQLIAEGYAREYTYGRAYHRQAAFKAAQTTAAAAQLGLWSPSACPKP